MSTTIDYYQGGPGTFSFTYGELTVQNLQCTVVLDGLFDDPNSYGTLLIKWTDSSSGIPCQISYAWGPGGGGNPASLFVSDMSGVQWTSPSNSLTSVNWGTIPSGYVGNWSVSSPQSALINQMDPNLSMSLQVQSLTFNLPQTAIM